MYYCPSCGTKFKEGEQYCMNCGSRIPEDIIERIHPTRQPFSKWWYLPLFTFIFTILAIGITTFILQYNTSKALELYTNAENHLMDANYQDANDLLETSLEHNDNFPQAQLTYEFTSSALQVAKEVENARTLLENKEYEKAIELVNEVENSLARFTGQGAHLLTDKINDVKTKIQLEQLTEKMNQEPSMNEFRLLIWQAEGINHPEADEIADEIRSLIVDHTYALANQELNNRQFNDALLFAEDGLKYAPDSEKLVSLITNINKEKLSFESEMQERMEQVMNTAYEEHQINENDAIKVQSVEVINNSSGQLVIRGEVESVATVPIHSILIDYALLHDKEIMITNEIFVFPDTLYPEEKGEFEFTHLDLSMDSATIEADIQKVTWYTD